MIKHRVIEGLAECYTSNKLVLTICDEDEKLREASLKNIRLCQKNAETPESIIVTVFDEYDDTTIQNPVLWLHLIVDTCQGFEEAANYDEWRLNEGYKDTAFFESLYSSYADIIPRIRNIIGKDVRALDSHHIEFNTDLAQALRNYHL